MAMSRGKLTSSGEVVVGEEEFGVELADDATYIWVVFFSGKDYGSQKVGVERTPRTGDSGQKGMGM